MLLPPSAAGGGRLRRGSSVASAGAAAASRAAHIGLDEVAHRFELARDAGHELRALCDGALDQALEGHSGAIRCVAFSADGGRLASGSADCTVRLWDPSDGSSHKVLKGHAEEVHSVAFSMDGHQLVSTSADGTVKVIHQASSPAL